VFHGDHSNYSQAANPRNKYDILLFVDRTTAARANPKVTYPDPGNGSHGEPTNLELSGSGAYPDGWRALNFSRQPYAVTIAEEETPEAGRAVRLARSDSGLIWGDGVLTQTFPVGRWRRQRVVFSAAMRAESPRIGTGAQLVVRFLSKTGEAVQVVQSGAAVRASHWIRHTIAADIPGKAEQIQICLVVTGAAAGWFGDLDLDVTAGEGAVAVSDADDSRPRRKRPARPWDVQPASLPAARQLRAGAVRSVHFTS
jgi:hypothetical protein